MGSHLQGFLISYCSAALMVALPPFALHCSPRSSWHLQLPNLKPQARLLATDVLAIYSWAETLYKRRSGPSLSPEPTHGPPFPHLYSARTHQLLLAMAALFAWPFLSTAAPVARYGHPVSSHSAISFPPLFLHPGPFP
ncbi:hypothetical protein GOP47_0006701 [Adiantum capillus-veneris]|uniref:Uncharacterized protein n=1 Tax=Adiantum capillus-veneris TaxID=13818 RepID=A0A9D4ZNA0_ADICA|nr:hypothetical protein GOP47_0006701 [Adiantum capillus-veneris]